MVVMQKQRGAVVGDPDLEDGLGLRGDLGPQAERVENAAGTVGDRRAAPVEPLADHRPGTWRSATRDTQSGAGTGAAEQQPDQTPAGDQQFDLLRHLASMEQCRRAVQRAIASSAFTPGGDGVISFPVCAVRRIAGARGSPASEGDSMARSLGYSARVSARRRHGWTDVLIALKRRLFESLGFALLLASCLLTMALLTYDPRDPSLNTAVDAPPHNFLGQNGAVLADLLRQSVGLAAFLSRSSCWAGHCACCSTAAYVDLAPRRVAAGSLGARGAALYRSSTPDCPLRGSGPVVLSDGVSTAWYRLPGWVPLHCRSRWRRRQSSACCCC